MLSVEETAGNGLNPDVVPGNTILVDPIAGIGIIVLKCSFSGELILDEVIAGIGLLVSTDSMVEI